MSAEWRALLTCTESFIQFIESYCPSGEARRIPGQIAALQLGAVVHAVNNFVAKNGDGETLVREINCHARRLVADTYVSERMIQGWANQRFTMTADTQLIFEHKPESMRRLRAACAAIKSRSIGLSAEQSPKTQLDVQKSHPISARMTSAEWAAHFGVNAENLRGRLRTFRKSNHQGWIENSEAASREARFLFEYSVVKPIVDDMKKTTTRIRRRKKST